MKSKYTNDTSQLNEEKAKKIKQEGNRTETESDVAVKIRSEDGDVTLKQENIIQNKALFDILIKRDQELSNLGEHRYVC